MDFSLFFEFIIWYGGVLSCVTAGRTVVVVVDSVVVGCCRWVVFGGVRVVDAVGAHVAGIVDMLR